MNFEGRDIISAVDFSKEDILQIMQVTADMEKVCRAVHVSSLLSDKLVAVIF